MSYKSKVEVLLEKAGVKIDGNRPWDIQVKNENLYRRVLFGGHLGLGESYVEGWWECEDLEGFFYRILDANLDKEVNSAIATFNTLTSALFNKQSPKRAFTVGKKHYNVSNELFQGMLDKRMMYSCGYWKNAENLDEAQENKLCLIFDKLNLKRGQRVLDIGCGFGGAAEYAATRYGVSVAGITISTEQAKLARERNNGLKVYIDVMDYRHLSGSYDNAYSIGMFEHVGFKNYKTYFEVVNRCLKEDGMFLLHTIGANSPATTGDPWTNKYIFPNGMLPSASQLTSAFEGLFILEDWQSFGYDYTLTLREWFKNFTAYWQSIGFSQEDRFYRIWKYYLLSFAGAFEARNIQVWQILLSKKGMRGPVNILR